jgi:glycosyltransferase involved in cell wall biosynthesis
MKVSVIIPCYNHERFVEEAIRSVLAQEEVEVDLRVVDDGSRDGSPEILAKLARELGFSLVLRENRGLVPSLRELSEGIESTYFCSMASDDRMPPGRLAAQVEILERHPEVPACAGQARIMDEHGNLSSHLLGRYLRSVGEIGFERIFLGEGEIHGASVLLRTEAFRAAGGYDSRFSIEDLPLWLALTRGGGRILVSDVEACHYRQHGSNLHSRVDLMFEQILSIVDTHADHPLHARAVRRWKAAWWSQLARSDRRAALRRLPELGSLDPSFLLRLPKILVPDPLQRSWLRARGAEA